MARKTAQILKLTCLDPQHPAHSLDLNSCEFLWAWLKERVDYAGRTVQQDPAEGDRRVDRQILVETWGVRGRQRRLGWLSGVSPASRTGLTKQGGREKLA